MEQPLNFSVMGVGTILDTTFKIYMKKFSLIFGIIALSYLPNIIISIVFVPMNMAMVESVTQNPENFDLAAYILNVLPVSMFSIIFFVVFLPLGTGALTVAVSYTYLGREITIVEAYRTAFKRLGTLIWSQFIVGLLTFLGLFLCVIPGILVIIWFSLLVPVVILESLNSVESRNRAYSLLEGHRMDAFLILLVAGMIGLAIGMAWGAGSALFLDPLSVAHSMISTVISSLMNIVVQPVGTIGLILLYYNCRIRKEGYDLELLMDTFSDGEQGAF